MAVKNLAAIRDVDDTLRVLDYSNHKLTATPGTSLVRSTVTMTTPGN